MKTALCCIGRLENQYAKEFVEHYKKLGFDKIFIYDNNQEGEEHFEDVLQDYVDNGFVEIIDYRDLNRVQFIAYNQCYEKYKNEYDWIAFFDFDEFLILEKDNDIKSYLSRFDEGKQCVLINWMIMDDNDLIHNDGRNLLERFTRPMNENYPGIHPFKENDHVKSIVRGGLDNINFCETPHSPKNDIVFCDSVGNICEYCYHKKRTFSGAYLKHFTTKTIEEWCNNKFMKGTADRDYDLFKQTYGIDAFFKFNKKTIEKERYMKKYLDKIEEERKNKKLKKGDDIKVALCSIGRLENRYAVEFVEYYKKLGVDNIIIIDNNFNDEEYFEDVLQPYIDEGFVIIENYRDKESCQTTAYTKIYRKYNKNYDWIIYLDFDEFLYITDGTNIKKYLSQDVFYDYDIIHVNWMNYGDNNLATYEDKPCQERFKDPLPYDNKYKFNFSENNHIKSIIRCGISEFIWLGTTHTPMMKNLRCCDCEGNPCENSPFNEYNFSKCYIKHYFTKTIEEWLTHKYYRQYADRPHAKLDKKKLTYNFFLLNKKTDEKAKYVLDTFGIDIYKLPKKW